MSESLLRLRLVSFVLGASVLAALASTGCVVHHHDSYGTRVHTVKVPPRSAHHGYVHHYHGVVLVFDRSWNGYRVQGHPHHYFHLGHYYRLRHGRWQKAPRFGGPWVWVESRVLPSRLRHRDARHDERDGRREAVKERREERREVVKERRGERREVAKERREQRHEVAKERREVAKERRAERREVAGERHQERRGVAKERREATRDRREERRETAKSEKTRRAKAGGKSGRGSPELREPGGDDAGESPANQSAQ